MLGGGGADEHADRRLGVQGRVGNSGRHHRARHLGELPVERALSRRQLRHFREIRELSAVAIAAIDAKRSHRPRAGHAEQIERGDGAEIADGHNRRILTGDRGGAEVVPQEPLLAYQPAEHGMVAGRSLRASAPTPDRLPRHPAGTALVGHVRKPGHHQHAGLFDQALAALIDHVEIDRMGHVDAHLAADVIQPEGLKAAQIVGRRGVANRRGPCRAAATDGRRLTGLPMSDDNSGRETSRKRNARKPGGDSRLPRSHTQRKDDVKEPASIR